MQVKVTKLKMSATLPKLNNSCVLELHSSSNSLDTRKSIIKFSTGLSVEIPEGYYGTIFPNNKLVSHGIKAASCPVILLPGNYEEVELLYEGIDVFDIPSKVLIGYLVLNKLESELKVTIK